MHGCREIRIAHPLAGQPSALACEPSDIGEMIANVMARRTDRAGIGWPAALLGAHRLLIDALCDQKCRHFPEEFLVEPMRQPPYLDARERIGWQQPPLAGLGAVGLVEVFGDDRGARHRRMALLDQHRRLAFGIERQEFLAPFPHALLDEPWRDAELAQREPHEARMRTERVMKQCDHGPAAIRLPLSRSSITHPPRGATFSVAP